MLNRYLLLFILFLFVSLQTEANYINTEHQLWTNTNDQQQSVLEQDSLALVALYNTCNGINWNSSEGWLIKNVSNWAGITINEGRVTKINFAFFYANGFYFWGNNLTGQMPTEIGDLNALTELDLSFNSLEGIIPNQIEQLIDLKILRISDNRLHGEIPYGITKLAELEMLDLADNQLSEILPDSIGNMRSIIQLYLDGNQLSGTIPNGIGKLTQLKFAFFQLNNFEGAIPPSIGELSNLKKLLLFDNLLSEPLPVEISKLNNTEIYIENNYLNFSDILNCNASTYELNWRYSPQLTTFKLNEIASDTLLTVEDCKHWKNIYEWYLNDSLINEISDTILLSSTGNYSCQVSNSLLQQLTIYSDTFLVSTPNNKPFAVAGKDTSMCSNTIIQLTALASFDPDGDSLSYEWISSETVSISDISSPTPSILFDSILNETTSFTIILKVSDGVLYDVDSIEIVVHPKPEQPQITIQNDNLFSSSNFGNQWYLNELGIDGANDSIYHILKCGNYSVQVTSEFGCISEMSETNYMIFSGNISYTYSTAIYPNPTNGLIKIDGLSDLYQSEISVFDSRGIQILRKLEKRDKTTINLSEQTSGVYFIQIDNSTELFKIIKR